MVDQPPTSPTTNTIPSRVFPLPGWKGPINTHWGQGFTGGTDLMVTASGVQPVVSMVTGKVQFVSSQATASKSGGNAVQIHGLDGLDYYYAHLAAPLGLNVGDTVSAGQMLGMADSTGNASGGPPHLHIGIGKGITVGTGADAGLGKSWDAVAMLKALVNDPRANDPGIVSLASQGSIRSGQPAGTIVLHPGTQPVSVSLVDRIRWLAQLLAYAGVPADKIPELVAISLAENRTSDPGALSSTHDIGLWQINIPIWAQKLGYTADQLKDPVINAKAAYEVFKAQGYQAWSTFNQNLQVPFREQVALALQGMQLPGGATPPPNDTPAGSECECPDVQLGEVAGIKLHMPDLGCTIHCEIKRIVEGWNQWWTNWREQHIADWLFVGAGVVIMALATALLIGQSTTMGSLLTAASKQNTEA